jgi:hypothetical protein
MDETFTYQLLEQFGRVAAKPPPSILQVTYDGLTEYEFAILIKRLMAYLSEIERRSSEELETH